MCEALPGEGYRGESGAVVVGEEVGLQTCEWWQHRKAEEEATRAALQTKAGRVTGASLGHYLNTPRRQVHDVFGLVNANVAVVTPG